MSLLCRATRRAPRRNLLLWPVPLLHPGRLPSQRAACRRLPLPWEPGQQVGVEGWPGLWRGPVWARRRCLRPGNNMQRNLQKFPETDSPGVPVPASQMGKEAPRGETSPDGAAARQQDPGPGPLAGACPPPDLWPSSRPKQHPIDDESYNADPEASPALQPPPLVQSPGGLCCPLAWASFATAACL